MGDAEKSIRNGGEGLGLKKIDFPASSTISKNMRQDSMEDNFKNKHSVWQGYKKSSFCGSIDPNSDQDNFLAKVTLGKKNMLNDIRVSL